MKYRGIFVGLVALACFGLAQAKTVQITLKKPAVFSEEGVHLSTDKGQHSLYAVNAQDKILKALAAAKKGQCLKLEVADGFDFTDASDIRSVGACQTAAAGKGASVKCLVKSAGQSPYVGQCLFTRTAGGSFSLSRPGGGVLLPRVTTVSVDVLPQGEAEVRGLTTDGINSRWGAAQRSTKDRACWTGADFEVCAW